MSSIQPRREVLLNGVAATTTSRMTGVDDAGRLSLQVFASGITTGSATFTAQVSNDGTNWVGYNRFNSNITNANTAFDTRIASVLIGTNSGSMLFVPAGDTFNFIRVVATLNNTNDGAYSAILYVD